MMKSTTITDSRKKILKRQANNDWVGVQRIMARVGKEFMIVAIRMLKPTFKWSPETGRYTPISSKEPKK